MNGAAGLPAVHGGEEVNNGNCAVTDSQRIDIPEVLAWIESFLD
jgi:hypothetical protein